MFYFTYFLGGTLDAGPCIGPVVSNSGVDNLHSAGTLLLAAVLCKRPGPKDICLAKFQFSNLSPLQ